jgi:DNA adenine methylase
MNTEYRRYVLCDSNRALINFFRALREDPERLILIARNVFRNGNNEDSYYEERKLFNHLSWDDECADDYVVRWAASFLYLNRHCFNGLYRTNRDGGFNVPLAAIRRLIFQKRNALVCRKGAGYNALFLCNDFRTSIPYVARNRPDSVIYCDPPYIPASKTANFTAYGKPFTWTIIALWLQRC